MCFLNVIGPAALDVYHTFEWDADGDNKKLDKIQQKFEEYFNPQRNETFERHVFQTRRQSPTETVDQFVTDLRVKASSCNFGPLTDSMLRDQVVSGIRSNQVRERLLREPDLTLAKAVKFCRCTEASTLHMQNLSLEETHAVSVQKPRQRKKSRAGDVSSNTIHRDVGATAATPTVLSVVIVAMSYITMADVQLLEKHA